MEIKSLTAALGEGIGSPSSTLPWARFDLTPYQVTRGSYLGLAAQYGVTVEPPPAAQLIVTRAFTRNWQNKNSANDSDYTAFDVDVPEGYEITGWSLQWERWAWTSEDWHFAIRPDLNTWLSVGGRLTMSVGTKLSRRSTSSSSFGLGCRRPPMTRGASAYGVRCATLPRRDTSSTASCSKTVSRNCRKS